MSTIVLGRVPMEELALAATHEALPAVQFRCERIVETGEDSVMPLLWAHAPDGGVDRAALDSALADDPSVRTTELLADFGDEWLYRMEWTGAVGLLVHMLTNGRATVLHASTDGDEWVLRVFYPDREHLRSTDDFCADHGLTFEVVSVSDMDGEPSGRYGLTDSQYEALVTALDRGYFDVPRRVNLSDVAREMGVTHQALSERLRRGTAALVAETLLVDDAPGRAWSGRGESRERGRASS